MLYPRGIDKRVNQGHVLVIWEKSSRPVVGTHHWRRADGSHHPPSRISFSRFLKPWIPANKNEERSGYQESFVCREYKWTRKTGRSLFLTFKSKLKAGMKPKTAKNLEEGMQRVGNIKFWGGIYRQTECGSFSLDWFVLYLSRLVEKIQPSRQHFFGKHYVSTWVKNTFDIFFRDSRLIMSTQYYIKVA